MDALSRLTAMGQHAHGVSLEYREAGTNWPKRWRARLVYTRNAVEDMRVTGYGDTAEGAIQSLADAFDAARSDRKKRADEILGRGKPNDTAEGAA